MKIAKETKIPAFGSFSLYSYFPGSCLDPHVSIYWTSTKQHEAEGEVHKAYAVPAHPAEAAAGALPLRTLTGQLPL